MSVPGTWPRREYCGLLKGEETDIEGKESKQNKEGQMESLYAAAVKNRTLISYGQAKGTKKETTYDVQKSFSWDLQQCKVKRETPCITSFTFSFNYVCTVV